MASRGEISDIVDSLLKFALVGGVITAGIAAPNSLQVLEKPVQKYMDKIDKRKRQREFKKVLRYMKHTGLVEGSYEHGLQLTEKGRTRAVMAEVEELSISRPKNWDKRWRVILYDVPEQKKTGRDALTRKLKELNFYQLQKSVWVYPFECRQEIETISAVYEIDKYVTYLETWHIDKQGVLKEKFKI